MICEYGCGQEAKYPPTKGRKKWCCSESYNSCSEMKRKNKERHLGQIPWNKNLTKETSKGVKRQAEKMSGRTKETSEGIRRMAEKQIGKTPWNKNLTKENNESIKNISEKLTGRTKETHEGVRRAAEKQSKIMKGRTKETHEGNKKQAEKHSKWMKAGGASYLNSFVRDDSKPENDLFFLACKLLPKPIHKYPIYRIGKGKRSYNADIADSSLGIILEYDGYYHFCDQEHKEYHNKRQQEIEEEGWKVLRYNIFQKFPTIEQMEKDINRILKEKE